MYQNIFFVWKTPNKFEVFKLNVTYLAAKPSYCTEASELEVRVAPSSGRFCYYNRLFNLVVCQDDGFKCEDNNVCIPRQWLCDSNWDCQDGSDERNCSRNNEPKSNNFHSLTAISVDVKGDEAEAGKTLTETAPETESNPEKCPLGELLCISDGACIRFEQLCDGTNDCADGADETDCGPSDAPDDV